MSLDRDDERAIRSFLGSHTLRLADHLAAGPASFIVPLAGDGSARRIYRIGLPPASIVAVVNPLPENRIHPDENEGWVNVRSYLTDRGVRAPEILASDPATGILLLEDLGNVRLFDLIAMRRSAGQPFDVVIRVHYERAIEILARLQDPTGRPFDPACTTNVPYTIEFVLAQEARYFHQELVRTRMGWDHDFSLVEHDCEGLAENAFADLSAPVFLHRDYQSRNLMIKDGSIVVIDFQGARTGPPEYDLAALLYDPYAAMPGPLREEMVSAYRSLAGWNDPPAWRRRFLANAANRMMQALGAFARLGGHLGKPGFLEHVPQGLANLEEILTEIGDCPDLLDLVKQLRR